MAGTWYAQAAGPNAAQTVLDEIRANAPVELLRLLESMADMVTVRDGEVLRVMTCGHAGRGIGQARVTIEIDRIKFA